MPTTNPAPLAVEEAAPVRQEALLAIARVRHAFLGRRGGVSEGLYDSLNCGFGSGDARERVAENRRRALALADLAGAALLTVHQTHRDRVVVVREPWPGDSAPRADAMVTSRPGLALGILTADCAPVLLADAEAGVVGAAHAGWRGALGGILEATVAAMRGLGARPEATVAAVGPCIAQASYEVGPDFPAPFLARDGASARFFHAAPRPGHFLFDLAGYVTARLRALGIGCIQATPADTCAEADRFFSYRRATRAGERDYGRQISLIALTR
ncbi:MAG: peptidoglycan editing factor PgeF [Rhodospirillaceae bacterium]|nr:peptidoglycan editing factor PgeF [Rhodospirillaceae bacterium]